VRTGSFCTTGLPPGSVEAETAVADAERPVVAVPVVLSRPVPGDAVPVTTLPLALALAVADGRVAVAATVTTGAVSIGVLVCGTDVGAWVAGTVVTCRPGDEVAITAWRGMADAQPPRALARQATTAIAVVMVTVRRGIQTIPL